VDKDREGAMFCTKCKTLYWDFIHPVCSREYQLMPENIYVRVRRQEDEFRPIKGD